jgi:xanthine dehydrogenase accessory factor
MAENDDVLKQAIDWLDAGKKVGMATVIGTWGSSPRPTGSLLAVEEGGDFVGSVSGGCVEGAVVEQALAATRAGTSKVLDFGISDSQAWEVGLACGGEMKVLVHGAPPAATLRRLLDERPIAMITDLASGTQSLVGSGQAAADLPSEAASEIRQALADNQSRIVEGTSRFVAVYNPPLRMVIVGAVHIAQTLAPMASLAGFAVTVVDPRHSFATTARFPGVALSDEWPDDAMTAIKPDSRTAIVTLTHDPKLDDPALAAALRSDAYYVGALGSRRTHAKRVGRLKEMGFDDAAISRIRAPVGLPLGGRKTAEIAVAILAEAIAACYGEARRLAA